MLFLATNLVAIILFFLVSNVWGSEWFLQTCSARAFAGNSFSQMEPKSSASWTASPINMLLWTKKTNLF